MTLVAVPAAPVIASPASPGSLSLETSAVIAGAAASELSRELDDAAADLAAGRMRAAFDCVKAVLMHDPNHPRALGLLGQVAVFADRPAIGLEALQRAVALDPRFEHRIWLSLCLAKLGCQDDALREVTSAIETMPSTANAYFAAGMVWHALGEHEQAASCYANCIALDPTRAAAHHRHARALQAIGSTEVAIDAYIAAERHCRTKPDYYADASSAFSDVGRFEEACHAARIAVELDPGCLVGHNNLGHALHCLNRSAEALVAYETAIAASATYTKAQFGYAVALLKCGDFARGWRQYESRWHDCQSMRLDLDVPAWRGEDLRGQTILLHAEQGLGDTLQFVRFAPLVVSRGGRVVLEVPASLVRLLRLVEGVADVIASGDPLPPIDLHCPLASLPLVFDVRLDTIPASPYLRGPRDDGVKPGGVPAWSAADPAGLIEQPDFVVGLVWAGDPRPSQPRANLIDRRRSTKLEVLAPLFAVEGIRFVSFQLGEGRAEVDASELPIIDAMGGVTDFADTAARLAGVDLLISVDTSMVHLAGGLGMPVWMLSRFDGCWRWLEQRDDSPWYPSMRIFRQRSPGDWSNVVAEVVTELHKIVGEYSTIPQRSHGGSRSSVSNT